MKEEQQSSMNYLILSPIGLSLFIVPHLGMSKDVEKIYFCTLDTEKKKTGKDMENLKGWEKFEWVGDYHEVLNKHTPSDLTIFIDDIGIGETGKNLRKQGFKVIGGSPFTDRIEDDRQFATELMSRIMDVPPSTSFTSWKDAMNFVKSHEEEQTLVFKPNDAEVPKEYTYVGKKGVKNLVEVMQSFQDEWKWKEDFQIQEFIKGTEVDFSAYFNGKDYITNSMVLYFENKAFMNDDVGPATGGSIAVEFARGPDEVFWPILQKLRPYLEKANYQGQISLNSIVSDETKKPHFLEFCGRVGYPSFPLDITLMEDREGGNSDALYQLFTAMTTGKNDPKLFPTDKIAVTISLFVPPAPSENGVESLKGEPMKWDEKWWSYFYPYYVNYDKKGKEVVLAGNSSWVGQITCCDKTLGGALEMMYKTYLPTLKLKDVEYRSDCGKSAKKRIEKLSELKVI